MDCKDLHSENANSPILFNLFGKCMNFNLVQLRNALLGIKVAFSLTITIREVLDI